MIPGMEVARIDSLGEGKSLKFAVFGPSLPPSRDWGYAGAGAREGTY